MSLGIFLIMALHVSAGIAYGALSISDIIRIGLAGYAADSEGNLYPPTSVIASYADLVRIVNTNLGYSALPVDASSADIVGGLVVRYGKPEPETWLKKAFKKVVNVWRALWGEGEDVRIQFVEYTSHDGLSYTLTIRFPDMPDGSRGKTVVITPEGVTYHPLGR